VVLPPPLSFISTARDVFLISNAMIALTITSRYAMNVTKYNGLMLRPAASSTSKNDIR